MSKGFLVTIKQSRPITLGVTQEWSVYGVTPYNSIATPIFDVVYYIETFIKQIPEEVKTFIYLKGNTHILQRVSLSKLAYNFVEYLSRVMNFVPCQWIYILGTLQRIYSTDTSYSSIPVDPTPSQGTH